jgi:hypothetical protein
LNIGTLADRSDLESVLRRRGHRIVKRGEIVNTLFPEDRVVPILESMGQFEYAAYFRPEFISPYLEQFRKTSFRKMVRELIAAKSQGVSRVKLEATYRSAFDDYMRLLRTMLLIREDAESVFLTRNVDNIGPSLEHYIAQLLVREFHASAEWGVVLEGLPRAGGDYDALAWLDPSLIYVECKSSDPNNVEKGQIRQFLQRSKELAPELAILLLDTDSNLVDFVNCRVNPLMRTAVGTSRDHGPIEKLENYPGLFFGYRRVFITGSEPSIERQIRRCLQYYYAQVKGVAFWDGDDIDFA